MDHHGGNLSSQTRTRTNWQFLSNFIVQKWNSLGLDPQIVLLMAKGALPPVIALAAGQNTSWAKEYTTLNYLVAIASVLSISIVPRAKFLRILFINTSFVCLGSAIALLQVQVAVSARHSTEPTPELRRTSLSLPDATDTVPYNASASAVSALGLFITIYFSNVLRALDPDMNLPCVLYSILTIIASTYAPGFPDMAYGTAFISKLLAAFLTGFAISAGVSLLLYPRTNRGMVFREAAGILKLSQACLGAQGLFLKKLNNFGVETEEDKAIEERLKETARLVKANYLPGAAAVKGFLQRAGEVHAKLHTDLQFAMKEIAYGTLGPEDLWDMSRHLGNVLISMTGMNMLNAILESNLSSASSPSDSVDCNDSDIPPKLATKRQGIPSREVFLLNSAMREGLAYISVALELEPKPKSRKADPESKADGSPTPGDKRMAKQLQEKIDALRNRRQSLVSRMSSNDPQVAGIQRSPKQLRQFMYTDSIIESVALSILEAVKWADSMVEEGNITQKRLFVPSWQQFMTLLMPIPQKPEIRVKGSNSPKINSSIKPNERSRSRSKLDPEHLPPETTFERITDYIRLVPRFLASPESALGFRTAVATMSIGILAFLRQTRPFFLTERIQWSIVMISISMMGDTGSYIFNFLLRLAGTVIAVVFSMAIWYIADQNAAAILVLLYIFLFCCFYFVIKYPQWLRSSVISITSTLLVIGYELQTQKIGIEEETRNGQPYYPIYILGPYRLAVVAGGVSVALFWTYFPYPTTTHQALRKDMARTIFLLADFYASAVSTLNMHLSPIPSFGGGSDGPTSLFLVTIKRRKLYFKLLGLLPIMREQSTHLKYEPLFGGKFPRATYDELIERSQKAFNCIAVMAHSIKMLEDKSSVSSEEKIDGPVERDLDHFASYSKLLCQETTSALFSAAASITTAQPLPPYLKLPNIPELRTRINEFDYEVFTLEHFHESGSTTLAVLEVTSLALAEEISAMIDLIKVLVGQVDLFSSTSSVSDNMEKIY